jgi:NAD(P)-dependent dehydrogenase (short-subunit alcohol dehydrogenase family)
VTISLDFGGIGVLVTGVGHRGQVGETVARAFGDRGARLFILDRNPAAVEERVADLASNGITARALACDLMDAAAVADAAVQVNNDAPGGLGAVINLAGGFAASGPVATSDPDLWHRQIGINLTTAYLATRAFLPLVRRARGSIVFFASAVALPGAGVAELSGYAAAKGGVVTLMHAVAAEERKNGVRANALAPTTIRTTTNVEAMGDSPKYVERETVADWVLWLASPISGPVSGQVIKLG